MRRAVGLMVIFLKKLAFGGLGLGWGLLGKGFFFFLGVLCLLEKFFGCFFRRLL